MHIEVVSSIRTTPFTALFVSQILHASLLFLFIDRLKDRFRYSRGYIKMLEFLILSGKRIWIFRFSGGSLKQTIFR